MMKVFYRNLTAIGFIFPVLAFAVFSPVARGEISGGTQPRIGVRRVDPDVATGNSTSNIPLIELSPGYGVNISFIKSGEIVEKVWLDNPAIASFDVDGCLSGLTQKCELEGATVLHLRRINPLTVPLLPKTNSSLLTVVARGNSGRRVYLFRVAMGDRTPNYHTIEVVPKAFEEPNIIRELPSATNLQLLSRGLEIAQIRGLILPQSRLGQRVSNFLISVRAGESISNAARKSGISLRLVNRLIELGNTSREGTLQQPFSNNSQ
jgi:hypothetical protein